MKILFLIYHGFSDYSGISKKIHYQVKGLRENGHEVHLCYYGFTENKHRCRYIDDVMIENYGKGRVAALRQRMDDSCIFDYCIKEGVEFVYARCFQNANPWLIRFFIRLRKAGIHAVTEIPTYPYDGEFKNFGWKERLELKIDQLFRNKLYQQMDALVTFSDVDRIFGQRTICISNGVDFDSIPLHHYQPSSINHNPSNVHFIGVAEVHPWHAYDRVIKGMGEYYANAGDINVFFHIVGGVHPSHMMHVFLPIIEKYGLRDKVIFHGELFGKQLDEVFDQCQFAIGSLGRHRSGITVIKTLKNREYATRGIPFIYSEQDSDFDQQPYIIKAPADESPIDIPQILNFINSQSFSAVEIRKTVENLTWKIQMQIVIDFINNN